MTLKRFLLVVLVVFGLGMGFFGISGKVQAETKPAEVLTSECESSGSTACFSVSSCPKVLRGTSSLSCNDKTGSWTCCSKEASPEQYKPFGKGIPEVKNLVEGINVAREKGTVNLMDNDSTSSDNFQSKMLIGILGHKDLKGERSEGALINTVQAISVLMGNAPASGQTYIADLMYNAKFLNAPPAYAQVGGLGFSSLEPILGAWKQFRNIAYMFFIVIVIVIGFMIMMRQKIGGQAAVTAQQAIPNIVIALIAVTFSYAVAGFLIDLMYVVMYLLVGLFPNQVGMNAVNKNIIQLGKEVISGGLIGNAYQAVEDLTKETLNREGIGTDVAGFIAGLTFSLIVAFAFLFAMISLFFELLKTYISIVISIVLSPILLMMGALPGRKDVFQGWVKGLVGNLIAFPIVLLLLIIHKLLTQGSAVGGGFLPPYLIGRGTGGAITALLGLAIMLIAKDLVVQAKKAINPKAGIFEQFGSALSSAVSKGWKGGELVPGLSITDTSKYGLTGKSFAKTGAVGIGTLSGGLVGGLRGLNQFRQGRSPRRIIREAGGGSRLGGRLVADILGSKFFNKNREERKKLSYYDARRKARQVSSKEGK